MYGPNVLYEIGLESGAVRAVGTDMGPQTSVGQKVAIPPLPEVPASELLPAQLAHQEALV